MAQTDSTELLLGYMPLIIRSEQVSPSDRYMCAAALGYATAGLRLEAEDIDIMQRIVNQFRERHLRDDEETVIDGEGE